MNDNLVWTYAFGAINYQIEHHLFPNMSSVHYPAVKPIVVKFCKEHNIPYVHHPTLLGAYKSFLKMMEYNKWVDENEKKD
jgi:linoleoyl-CoA desaturase